MKNKAKKLFKVEYYPKSKQGMAIAEDGSFELVDLPRELSGAMSHRTEAVRKMCSYKK